MGLLDRATATARLLAREAEAKARELITEFDEGLHEDGDYVNIREKGKELLDKSKKALEEGKVLGSELMTEFGETKTGATTGEVARKAGQMINAMPVLSALIDSFKARHGVEVLAKKMSEDPLNPMCAVQLAEALGRVKRELRYYQRTRSVISPTYALRRHLIIGAVGLGDATDDPTYLRLQKHAFNLALSQVRSDPTDTLALHSLARVYLNQEESEHALRSAKLALLSNPADATVWVTLSRCYLAMDRFDDAKQAAKRATELGAGYGNEVLAAVTLTEADGLRSEVAAKFEIYRGKVTPQDREAYLGAPMDARTTWESLKEIQMIKGTEVWNKVVGEQ